jgi:hypothetical protein
MLDNDTKVFPLVMQYFVRKMPYHYENKQIILDMIERVERVDTTVTKPDDRYQRITKYDYLMVDTVTNRPWVDFVTPKIMNVLSTMPNQLGWHLPEINSIWFQQYNTKDHHQWHPHCGCNWAGIYFLETPIESHITEYIEPFTQKLFSFTAEEGDIVIFPAQLIHRSAAFLSANRKTVIAFNFDQMHPNIMKKIEEEQLLAKETLTTQCEESTQ